MRKHVIWKFDLAFLQKALNNSKSYAELFSMLNINHDRAMIKMLQYRIKKDGLDNEIFKKNTSSRSTIEKKLNDILVKDSTYLSTIGLKKKLLKNNLINYECSICGINNWNGVDLVLQLDHINGINNDNRLENLRLLCPNCHSQTETYAGKKNKPIKEKNGLRKCNCCGIEVNKKVFCEKCDNDFKLKLRKVNRPNRDELIELVNKIGFSATGRKFGVSDNAIRKWLK